MINQEQLSALFAKHEEQFVAFEVLVKKWQHTINLVGPSTIDNIRERHTLDSLQLVPSLEGVSGILDLGSGGGFPAIILAIAFENTPIYAAESDQRKAIFLQTAAREFGLKNMTVLNKRIETITQEDITDIDVVTARACADLQQLSHWCHQIMETIDKKTLRGVFLKGMNVQNEIEAMGVEYTPQSLDIYDSLTQEGANIVDILWNKDTQ